MIQGARSGLLRATRRSITKPMYAPTITPHCMRPLSLIIHKKYPSMMR